MTIETKLARQHVNDNNHGNQVRKAINMYLTITITQLIVKANNVDLSACPSIGISMKDDPLKTFIVTITKSIRYHNTHTFQGFYFFILVQK